MIASMNRGRALSQLTEVLLGSIPPNANWPEIIAIAGEQLVLPELYARLHLSGGAKQLPADVYTLLREINRRNRRRNMRLFATLKDALGALNKAGIVPILLKGCGTWVVPGRATVEVNSDRMVSDLDLLVRPCEISAAVAALERMGFEVGGDNRSNLRHPVVDMGRKTDVGMIDLHQRAPGPVGLAEVDDLHAHCRVVQIGAAMAKLPHPELQILIAALHDQFRDGNFWRGGFNLRHLLDIATLANGPNKVDWARLEIICKSAFARTAVAAQLHAARRIAGAEIPDEVSRVGRLHYLRQRCQFTWPAINAIFRRAGVDFRLWRALSSRPIAS